jgi:hypothetical protein
MMSKAELARKAGLLGLKVSDKDKVFGPFPESAGVEASAPQFEYPVRP